MLLSRQGLPTNLQLNRMHHTIEINYANYDDTEIAACRIVMDNLTINLCCIFCPPIYHWIHLNCR